MFVDPLESLYNPQHPLANTNPDTSAHCPTPEVDILRPDQHCSEEEPALEPLNQGWPHRNARQFLLLSLRSNGADVEEHEIVDMKASLEYCDWQPAHFNQQLKLLTRHDSNRQQRVDDEIAQQVEKTTQLCNQFSVSGHSSVKSI